MEEFVLKAKHYQIFLSLSIPTLIAGFFPDINPSVPLIKLIFVTLAYTVWIFVLGRALNDCIPRRHRLSDTFQAVALFGFGIIFTAIMIFADMTITFFGFALLIPGFMLFCIFYLYYFAAKALTSAELGKRTSFSTHIVEIALLMSGVLGIWIIQPRVNKLYEAQKQKAAEIENQT